MSLSLLSMCERGFKRLQECWECYSDKLTEPGVYQPLLSIAVKLRRGAKAQFKVGEIWRGDVSLPPRAVASAQSDILAIRPGSGRRVREAADGGSHARPGERGESRDGRGEPEGRSFVREDSCTHSHDQQGPCQDKERSSCFNTRLFVLPVQIYTLLYILYY